MDSARRAVTTRSTVVSGSVWESRMKIDEVKGGIKVFTGEENPEGNNENNASSGSGQQVYKRVRPKQSPTGVSGKRKTWKSESSEGFEKNPIQIAKQKPELNKNLDEQFKELSVSADGIKKSPIQRPKSRSESIDGIDRSPVQKLKTRSMSQKGSSESSDGKEKSPIQLRKVKLEANKALADEKGGPVHESPALAHGNERNSIQVVDEFGTSLNVLTNGIDKDSLELRKEKFESNEVVEESSKEIEKNPIGIRNSRSDEICEELSVCEEKVITSNFSNVDQVKSPPQLGFTDNDGDGDEEDWDEEIDEEIEMEIEKKTFDVKEINIPEQKPKNIVIQEKKIVQNIEKPVPISPIVRKQPSTVVNHPKIIPKPTRTKPVSVSDGFQRVPRTHNKLQSLVDLVMWRDVSRSAFVFGIGTFIIISSSYTRDINISLITVLSYLGLVYLAVIFLFRSIICRGAIDMDNSHDHVVGEEEAVWLLKLVLPYINEFLLKLRALFSGDPSTTMKLAVMLFVLARCGNSITIWKMAKLGFFGVFTVPKVCSSYSSQLTAYGTFWVRRFRDAWESCSHKKAVAFAIFTLVWNLSSIVARIWAVFMLFVAFRYYQHSLMREDWVEEEAIGGENSWQGQPGGGPRLRHGPTLVEIKKQKKGS